MRSGAVAGVLAAFAVGLVLVVAIAATRESRLVYSIGTGALGPVADVKPGGGEVCKGPLAPPPEAFDRVVFTVGTYFRSGPPLEVLVRSVRSGRVLGRGRLAGGYPDIARAPEHSVPVGELTPREPVDICVRNPGRRRVALYGAPGLSHRTSSLTADGTPINSDVAVRLERGDARSLLTRLPRVFEHAATFKAGWIGAWTFWLLALAVATAVPALLALAVGRAARADA